MKKKEVYVGIMSWEDYQQYTLDIVAGKRKPMKNAPQIWFNSLQTMAHVLSEKNQVLLGVIEREQPSSIRELSHAIGRKEGNLSRSLKTLEKYGVVELIRGKKAVRPVVKANSFIVQFGVQ